MVASGFAALGYQVVWTQQGALWLGHEAAAMLAVVAAFFAGLAAGALVLGGRIERSAVPAQWYAACELATGLWAIAAAFLMQPASSLLLDLIGAQPSPAWHWSLAFGATFLMLLPATAAMGATLPAMERVLARWQRDGAPIPGLYAANTLGAVLGVLGAALWLIPAMGLAWTTIVCATFNFACAAVMTIIDDQMPRPAPVAAADDSRGALATLAATGFLGIGYEVLGVRVLSQVAENTIYTFAAVLAIYLVGTTLGAGAYARLRDANSRDHRNVLLEGTAGACVAGVIALAAAEPFKVSVQVALGHGMGGAIAAEAALALAVFLVPAIAMGALFSHLASQARARGVEFSRSLAANTAGAAVAPLAFGVVLMAGAGAKLSLLAVAAGYLVLLPRAGWRSATAKGVAAALAAVALLPFSLAIVDVPAGGRIASYAEGTLATVSVVEDAQGVARLHINNRQQEGSSATVFADARQALLPLLLHPAPRKALFLGLGTGVTAFSAAQDASLKVDAVELLPEVIDASALFTRDLDAATMPRVIAGDARRFVRTSRESYDVIVSDNFHPARSGSGSLYTVEHFAAVRARLAPGGVFCQWLPLHQLDLETLRSIVRSFLAANPGGWAMLATNSLETPVVGLVARRDATRFDALQVRARLESAAWPRHPAAYGIDDDLALLGAFFAGPRALASFASDAPLNTDDRPVVAYRAPRITYAPDSQPRDRLLVLLHETWIATPELLAPGTDDSRLAAYWSARERFLEAGLTVTPSADVRRMLAQVREPLLAIVRSSPDFRPAYDPLLRMAIALTRVDRAAGRGLLAELQAAQPARPEAANALQDLNR